MVQTPAMQVSKFLTGAFRLGAQIFDRMSIEVLISTEDQDNFVKNMITIRAEERLALAVYRPAAFIYGTAALIYYLIRFVKETSHAPHASDG